MLSFEKRAQNLGHDIDRLKAGDEIETLRTVGSFDEFYRLFHDGVPDETRKARLSVFEKSNPKLLDPANTTMEALFYRGTAAIAADHQLTSEDKSALEKFFPITVKLISKLDKPVTTNWNLSPNHTPAYYNFGTVTIKNGGALTAIGSYINFLADTIDNQSTGQDAGEDSGVNYTIGVFGIDGADGDPVPDHMIPPQAAPGSNSTGNVGGSCSSASAATKGSPGTNGSPGLQGINGEPGSPNLTANFVFTAMTGNPVFLLARSGAGGNGGPGGNGGTGGQGGVGGTGCSSGCEGTASANGGQGGDGADGGQGGDGKDGADGHPVLVTLGAGVPKTMVPNNAIINNLASGGPGGGVGGAGYGGPGGASGKDRNAGQTGTKGNPGKNPGTKGADSKYAGNAPAITVANAQS